MSTYPIIEDDFEREKEERKRFYAQQKSLKPECNFGNKNCDTCDKRAKCVIRQYVE